MAYDGSLKFDTKVDTSGFSTGISKISSLAKTGLKVATGLITGAATAIGGIAAASIQAGQSFEEGMSQVAAVSGATGKDLEALRKKAEEMGAKTKFSATESAEAMNYMAMAGWKTEDMLNGIEGIMNLAAASGVDLATTSDIVTDALTAFGLSAKDSGHFADVLAQASANANTNVDLMGETFKYVAPVAGALGFSVEDTAVAIGLMANAGIKGSQAGTALRSTFTRLAKPTKQSQQAMDALGISLTDNEGNVKDLNVLLKEMREKFSTLTDAEKAEYAALLSGQQGMSGLLAIVNASDEDFDKLTESINNSTGATENMARVMQNNLKGKITIMKSALEGLGIKIYDNIEAPMMSAVDAATDGVNKISAALEEGGLAGAVEAAGGVLADLALRAAEAAPQMINAGVSLIKSFVQGISDHKHELAEAAKEIVSALVNGIIDLLPSQIGEPIRRIFNEIGDSIQNGGLKKGIETLVTFFGNLVDTISKIIDVVGPALVRILDFIGEHLDIILPVVIAVFTAFESYKVISGIIDGVSTAMAGLHAIMNANPYVLVASLVLALVAGLISYLSAIDDVTDGEKAMRDADDRLSESLGNLGGKVEEAANQIKNANSHYGEYADSLVRSDEELHTLQTGIEEVQSGITEILRSESTERNGLVDTEILKLEEYYDRQNELFQQQLAIETDKQQAMQARIRAEVDNFSGSISEYEGYQADWLKTAAESRDAELALLDEQYTIEFAQRSAELEKRTDLTEEEKRQELASVIDKYSQLRQAANDHYSEFSDILLNKYSEISGGYGTFVDEFSRISGELETEQTTHAANMNGLLDQYNTDLDRALKSYETGIERHNSAVTAYNQGEEAETDRHGKVVAKSLDEFEQALASSNDDLIAHYVATAAEVAKNGGTINKEQADVLATLIRGWNALPEDADSKAKIASILGDASKVLQDQYPAFKADAETEPEALVQAWTDLLKDHSVHDAALDTLLSAKDGIEEGGEKAAQAALEQAARACGLTEKEIKDHELDIKAAARAYATSGKDGFDQADLIRAFGNGTQGAVDAANRSLQQNARMLGSSGKTVGDNLTQGMIQGVNNGLVNLDKAGVKAGAAVVDGTKEGAGTHSPSTKTRQVGVWLYQGLVEGMYSGVGFLQRAANWVGAVTVSAVQGNTYNQAVSYGYNISIGMANGIYAGASSAINAAAWMASNALAAAKHRLGIHSPSRVFRDEVGEMIPAGIQEGITEAMPGLLQSTKDEMARLTEEMKSAVDLESGTMTIEKTGQMEYEASLAERLAQRNINVTGTVEDDRPMEIHTHLHVGKRELAQEITPEVNHQLYRIDKRENNRGEG